MRPFSTYEANRHEFTAEETFMSVCFVSGYTSGSNSFGEDVPTYASSGSLACGFEYVQSRENNRGDLIPVEYDALLRVEVGAVTDARNRITVDGVLFDIVAIEPRSTVSLVKLKRRVY